SRETHLVRVIPNSDQTRIIAEIENLAKSLRAQIPDDLAGRAVMFSILKSVSSKIGFELPFAIPELDSLVAAPVPTDYIILRPQALDLFFERLIPQSYRKISGQFLTPAQISEFMTSWGLESGCSNILDPAVGP